MAFLETKHTLSRVNILKKDLMRALLVFSCISMIAFIGYYIYLIIQNLQNPLYIVIYSCFIAFIISLFCVEIFIQEDKKLLKNEKRQAVEKKRKFKIFIKVLKFIAKSVLVGIAMYETFTNFDVSLNNIINICSVVLLAVQILFEFIAHYIMKQIDYFRLSLEMDMDESVFVKMAFRSMMKDKKTEDKAIEISGGKKYTPLEEKMRNEIRTEADKYAKEVSDRKEEIEKMASTKRLKVTFWKRLKNRSK